MAQKKKGNLVSRITEMIESAVNDCGCTLWDVEFVKEGSDFNLVVYIDKPEGITLDDCEMVNDAIEPILDENDPIEGSYYLEVSSPGLERELKTPAHIKAFIGERVIVKLYAAKDGRKVFDATIVDFDEEKSELVIMSGEEEIRLDEKEVASIKTVYEF